MLGSPQTTKEGRSWRESIRVVFLSHRRFVWRCRRAACNYKPIGHWPCIEGCGDSCAWSSSYQQRLWRWSSWLPLLSCSCASSVCITVDIGHPSSWVDGSPCGPTCSRQSTKQRYPVLLLPWSVCCPWRIPVDYIVHYHVEERQTF